MFERVSSGVRWAIICLALAVGSKSVSAANLVSNGDFASNTAGWTSSGPAADMHWSATDSAGAANSGSLSLEDLTAAFVVTAFTCIPVSPQMVGQSAALSVHILGGSGRAALAFHSATDCSNEFGHAQTSATAENSVSWTALNTTTTVPSGAVSMEVILINNGGVANQLLFDNINLEVGESTGTPPAGTASPLPVPALKISGIGWLALILVVVAIGARRFRRN